MDELLQAVQAELGESLAASTEGGTDAADTGVYQARDAAAQAQLDGNMTQLHDAVAGEPGRRWR